MRIYGKVNNISKELKPRTLKPGEVVTYKYLGGAPNNDPNEAERKARPYFWPEAVTLRLHDNVYDPYKQEYVEIGIPTVDGVQNGEVKRFDRFIFKAQANDGVFAITGGTSEAQDLFEFFELTNKNLSNPNRTEQIEPWFKRIDFIAQAKEDNKKRNKLKDAIMLSINMNDSARREFAAAMAWDELADEDVLISQVEEFAMNQPEDFLAVFGDERGLKDKALLKKAITDKIIRYDVAAHKIYWVKSETVIAALERVDGKNYIDQFYEWIDTNKNGQNVMTSIKKQLDGIVKGKLKEKESEV